MRLVFAGTPEVAVPSLDALVASSHEVVGVVTRPDAPAGRGRTLVASPVRRRAEELGLPVLTPRRPSEPDFQEALRALAPDVCPVVAYGALVPRSALDIPRLGWVNLHFSLLPAWRGAAPVQHAVMAGDEVTGATTFLLEEGLDTGPVLGMMTEQVHSRDTSGDLLDRLATAGAGLLVASLDGLGSGDIVPREQPGEGVSLAPKITVEDARIDWGVPGFVVDRRVRGCTPAPGAWTTFRDARLGLDPVTPLTDADPLAPGELRVTKREVLVGTATGPVRLGTVRPVGKKPMPAPDWARGVRIEPGERVGA
ncbi:methionyl-tRNA formyltransferase [Lapillicoccus jejuensis]|uniref:Methionyl-tRNA formyltransferase n=1 Tax=Lapillicoccus jejuensis TaxID=402171 RepID=A0A542E6E9_9MICO|nr:methionyl-tRNA formyltransferase [Lapillicoccus jejuensis]TQJ10913.1 methionyl-tRNA formyltransferase [Lapillicoccus jejuensis]